MTERKKFAILVGGGPAPGINSVIGAATIRTALDDVEVLGIRDGFEWVMKGDIDHVVPLTIEDVSRIHFRGGSCLRTSRANPNVDPQLLENTVGALLRLGVSGLITIGGDDTCLSAMRLHEQSAGRIRVVHVPKTIDDDLDLPVGVDTFGYQTARHVGVEIVQNIMVDASTTSRWYFLVAMGRSAGHLALGMGKAAGATLTLIPEEFGRGKIRFRKLVDTLAGAIVKRLACGRRDGVAVIGEGVVLSVEPDDLKDLDQVGKDPFGNVRISDLNLGEILKRAVSERLGELGVKRISIIAKNVGYELRCADPIPFDMEYARDLGTCAAQFLLEGGGGVMVSMQQGRFAPIPFAEILDRETGKIRVRRVDIDSTGYAIARRYMIRLRRDDFDDPARLSSLAGAAGLPVEEFRRQFAYLVEDEPPALRLRAG